MRDDNMLVRIKPSQKNMYSQKEDSSSEDDCKTEKGVGRSDTLFIAELHAWPGDVF